MAFRQILALAAIVGVVSACALSAAARNGGGGDSTAAATKGKGALRISVMVQKPLFPGVRRRVLVKIRNRGTRKVRIRKVAVVVPRAARGCPKRALRIERWRKRKLVIAPKRRRVAVVWARLKANAPNACQRTRFRLRAVVRARAVKGSGAKRPATQGRTVGERIARGRALGDHPAPGLPAR